MTRANSQDDLTIKTDSAPHRVIQLFYRYTILSLLILFIIGLSGIFAYISHQQSTLIKSFAEQEEQLYREISVTRLPALPNQGMHRLLTNTIFNETRDSLNRTFFLLTLSWSIYLLIIIFVMQRLRKNAYQLQRFVDRLQGMNSELQSEIGKREEMTLELEKLNTEFKYQSLHDSLTQLPNRRLFEDRLHMAIEEGKRKKTKFALLFLDLDGFKLINDTLGHDAGDELLRIVSQKFKNTIRSMDTAARLGGDEFAFILTDIDKPESAVVVSQRILDSVRIPISIKNQNLEVSASIGITIYPNDSENEQTLMKNADAAMYSAKTADHAAIQFYRKEMNASSQRELWIRSKLGHALQTSEIELHYQPIVDTNQHAILYFEALLFWNHPELGPITPHEIIEFARCLNLYSQLEEWIISTACQHLKKWKEQDFAIPKVFIKIFPFQLESKDYVKKILDLSTSSGSGLGTLVFEVSEAYPIENKPRVRKTLEELVNLGAQIALNHFGTNHSSFDYLRWIPVHILKIDPSFVTELDKDKNTRNVTKAMVDLAKNLQLEIIAEGVSTKEQLKALNTIGCYLVQGGLFGSPLPAEKCLHLTLPSPQHRE